MLFIQCEVYTKSLKIHNVAYRSDEKKYLNYAAVSILNLNYYYSNKNLKIQYMCFLFCHLNANGIQFVLNISVIFNTVTFYLHANIEIYLK